MRRSNRAINSPGTPSASDARKCYPLRSDAQFDQQVGEPDVGHPLDRHPDGYLGGLNSGRHDLHVTDCIGPNRKQQ